MYGISSTASERSDGAAIDSTAAVAEDSIDIPGLELLLSLNLINGIQGDFLEELLKRPMVKDIGAVKDDFVPLQSLCPISISELQVSCRHTGRVLYGELCAEPFKMVAVHTAVVDEAGQKAKLCVYNALPSNYRPLQIQRLFAKGLKVAIREPYFKYGATDGSPFIRVDNPSDFVAVHDINTDSSQSTKKTSHSPSCSEPLEVLIHAQELRTQGNQAFAAKDWEQSIKLYTETLQCLLHSASPTSSARVPSLSLIEVSQELVLAYSNRAEARLRLEHFESANEDALKALQLHPGHAKSLNRRGRALHGLHVYDEAASCFREVVRLVENSDNNIGGVREALQASEVCEKQARTGEYDLVEMMKEVEEGKEPVCAEFVGPVTIGRAADEALGRGLLLTKDVDCGELLLVSKAVAKAKVHPSSLVGFPQSEVALAKLGYKSSEVLQLCHMDIVKQVVQRALSSNRFREQVYSLESSLDIDVPCQLYVPNMTLFLQDGIAYNDNPSSHASIIDMEKVLGVTMVNVLAPGCSLNVALWLLPSFINHSCIPNASWIMVGEESLFVRATRHLTKGEEVTVAYMDNPALPYDWRATFLRKSRGFECRCERCAFERIMKPFIEPLQTKLALQKEVSIKTNVAIVEILEAAFQQSTTINDGDVNGGNVKQWLRTSFCASYYVTLFAMFEKQVKIKHRISLMTLLTAVNNTVGAAEVVVVLVRQALAHGQKLSRRSKRVFQLMCLCLYGKQQPTSLEGILSLREQSIVKNTFMG